LQITVSVLPLATNADHILVLALPTDTGLPMARQNTYLIGLAADNSAQKQVLHAVVQLQGYDSEILFK
jgi:hypothetical protein